MRKHAYNLVMYVPRVSEYSEYRSLLRRSIVTSPVKNLVRITNHLCVVQREVAAHYTLSLQIHSSKIMRATIHCKPKFRNIPVAAVTRRGGPPHHEPQHGRPAQQQQRWFQSSLEYNAWSQRVVATRLNASHNRMENMDGKIVAPFLCDVNPLAEQRLQFRRLASAKRGTPSFAMVQATWPLSSDKLLERDVSIENDWSAFRLSKFYEALDALTADSAYLHTNGHEQGISLVTAGHYFSRKLARTQPNTDVTLRCYPTAVGNSSLEIRTDAIQNDTLINYCHTIMVCVDSQTLRPLKGRIPPLVQDDNENDDPHQAERYQLAQKHAAIRKQRSQTSVSLYSRNLTHPPDDQEMRQIHAKHQSATQQQSELYTPVSTHTHEISLVVFPEQRNVHGKTFGGFVVAQAFDFAYMAAVTFLKGQPFASLGIDEATFLQPVGIGDLVHFRCRVVHSDPETGVFRVSVNVDVLDKSCPTKRPNRTNHLRFVFGGHPAHVQSLLPVSYTEILGYVNAARRNAVEPIAPATLRDIATFVNARVELSGTGTSYGTEH